MLYVGLWDVDSFFNKTITAQFYLVLLQSVMFVVIGILISMLRKKVHLIGGKNVQVVDYAFWRDEHVIREFYCEFTLSFLDFFVIQRCYCFSKPCLSLPMLSWTV